MTDVYSTAASITVVLGALLITVFVYKYVDEIANAITNVLDWTAQNILSILLAFFLLSLSVTIIASFGVP
jgi:small neutral amino acid transporter SnatA (MarC family)